MFPRDRSTTHTARRRRRKRIIGGQRVVGGGRVLALCCVSGRRTNVVGSCTPAGGGRGTVPVGTYLPVVLLRQAALYPASGRSDHRVLGDVGRAAFGRCSRSPGGAEEGAEERAAGVVLALLLVRILVLARMLMLVLLLRRTCWRSGEIDWFGGYVGEGGEIVQQQTNIRAGYRMYVCCWTIFGGTVCARVMLLSKIRCERNWK